MSTTLKAALATIGTSMLVVVVFYLLLGGGSPLVFSRFEEALNMVPDPFETPFTNQPIEFADYLGSRRAAGLEQVVGLQAYLSLSEESRRTLYQGLPNPAGGLRDREVELYEATAIDLYGFDLGVWVDQPDLSFRNFMVLQGVYDKEAIVKKLLGLGYKQAHHSDVEYYWLFEQAEVDPSHPLGSMAPHVNRVAFVNDKLLLGSDDVVIESLIDVQLGRVPSMRADRNLLKIVRSADDGILGGVVLSRRWLRDSRGPSSERSLEFPETWGNLADYALVLFGYKQTGESSQIVLALFGVTAAGERNADELKTRWDTFRPAIDQGGLVKDLCSPFSTSVVVRTDRNAPRARGSMVRSVPGEYSVLSGKCPIINSEGSGVNNQGAGLWRNIYESGQLAILIGDVDN